jgi:membrane protease YdiL (CAAX protease family)
VDTPRPTTQPRAALLAVLVGVLAGVLAYLLPTLTAGLDEATITGALLAVALAALVHPAQETAGPGGRTTSFRATSRRPVPLVLATRATDPTHHPLRPRAPGRA